MSTEENKKLVLRWKDEIWNKRNVNIIDELYASNYVDHIVGPLDLFKAARHSHSC